MAVTLAGCQLAPTLGDVAGNREMVADAVGRAAALGAAVVVLPELVSSGYVFDDTAEALTVAERPDGATITHWCRLAADHEIVLVGGFCERGGDADPDGSVFNSAAVVDPSGLRAVYRKVHLWDRERLIFTAGFARPPVIATAVGAIATMICYDLEFPEWVRLPALAGAQLLAAPVNWPDYPRPDGERPGEVVRVQADAGVNRMAVLACDRTGTERGVDWVGGTVIADLDGWAIAGGWANPQETIVVAEVDLDQARNKVVGGLSNIHADRRPELYGPVLS